MDPFNVLPDEVSLLLLEFVPALPSFIGFSLVNWHWRELVEMARESVSTISIDGSFVLKSAHPSDKLAAIRNLFPNVTTLRLTSFWNAPILEHLLSYFPKIESLEIINCYVSDKLAEGIVQKCPDSLEHILFKVAYYNPGRRGEYRQYRYRNVSQSYQHLMINRISDLEFDTVLIADSTKQEFQRLSKEETIYGRAAFSNCSGTSDMFKSLAPFKYLLNREDLSPDAAFPPANGSRMSMIESCIHSGYLEGLNYLMQLRAYSTSSFAKKGGEPITSDRVLAVNADIIDYLLNEAGGSELLKAQEKALGYSDFLWTALNDTITNYQGLKRIIASSGIDLTRTFEVLVDVSSSNDDSPRFSYAYARKWKKHKKSVLTAQQQPDAPKQTVRTVSYIDRACDRKDYNSVCALLELEPKIIQHCPNIAITLAKQLSGDRYNWNKFASLIPNLHRLGADLKAVDDENGYTLMHYAAKGDCTLVNYLISAGFKELILVKDNKGQTPLHLSVNDPPVFEQFLAQYPELVKIRFSSLKDISTTKTLADGPVDDQNVLHALAKRSNLSSIKYVVTNFPADAARMLSEQDSMGRTPLLTLLTDRHLSYNADAIIQLLLTKNNANMVCKSGRSALHYICQDGSGRFITLLLKQGLDVNLRDNEGNTPLHVLCKAKRCWNSVGVDTLLDAGADPNIENKAGETPLLIAMQNRNQELVELLFNRCSQNLSDPNEVIEALGMNLFECGIRNFLSDYILCSLRRRGATLGAIYDVFPCSLDCNEDSMDVDQEEKDTATALHVAAEAGNVAALAHIFTWTPSTPLYKRRSSSNSNSNAQPINNVEEEIDVDAKTARTKRTALHLACEGGHHQVVTYLLEKGVDPLAKDYKNRTPLDYIIAKLKTTPPKMPKPQEVPKTHAPQDDKADNQGGEVLEANKQADSAQDNSDEQPQQQQQEQAKSNQTGQSTPPTEEQASDEDKGITRGQLLQCAINIIRRMDDEQFAAININDLFSLLLDCIAYNREQALGENVDHILEHYITFVARATSVKDKQWITLLTRLTPVRKWNRPTAAATTTTTTTTTTPTTNESTTDVTGDENSSSNSNSTGSSSENTSDYKTTVFHLACSDFQCLPLLKWMIQELKNMSTPPPAAAHSTASTSGTKNAPGAKHVKKHPEVVAPSKELKAVLDLADEPEGDTPLHYCFLVSKLSKGVTRSSVTTIAKMLLDAGADVNLLNKHKESPLHTACRLEISMEQAVELLLSRGANPLLKDADGTTPMMLFTENEGEQASASRSGSAKRKQLLQLLDDTSIAHKATKKSEPAVAPSAKASSSRAAAAAGKKATTTAVSTTGKKTKTTAAAATPATTTTRGRGTKRKQEKQEVVEEEDEVVDDDDDNNNNNNNNSKTTRKTRRGSSSSTTAKAKKGTTTATAKATTSSRGRRTKKQEDNNEVDEEEEEEEETTTTTTTKGKKAPAKRQRKQR